MPQVYEVTARFRRQTQPVQYQAAESELIVKAQFDKDEYQSGGSAQLLAEVQAIVLSSLGLSAETPAPTSSVATAGQAGPKEEPKPSKTRAKKDAAPAETKPAATSADAAADMGGPASVSQPAATEGPKPVTDEDLQKTASAASQRLGGAGPVKELMKKFGVARLGELPQEKRVAFVAECDALKKE